MYDDSLKPNLVLSHGVPFPTASASLVGKPSLQLAPLIQNLLLDEKQRIRQLDQINIIF